MSVNEKMTAIADAIRDKTGGTEKLGLDAMADGVEQVYEYGKQAEKEAFWKEYLYPKGYSSLSYRFAGNGWNDHTFYPPKGTVISAKNLASKSASGMFLLCSITDLKGRCEELGVTIDLSHVTQFSQFLADSWIETFPTIDTRSASNLNNILFAPQSLHTVERLILKDDGSQQFNDRSFYLCGSLQNITFEGTIGYSVDFHWSSLLSNDSVQSIIDCLKDLTGEAQQTLTFHADVGARLSDAQKATITAKNWELVY